MKRSPVKDRLGVAVIGLGVGEQHARAYQVHPDCRLIWLYDLDRSRAEALAGQLGSGAVAPDMNTILSAPDVNIVSIASYDNAHFEQSLAALRAGKHVFVEKPLCCSISELKEIWKTWNRKGGKLKLASNLVLQAAPLYRWLREQIQSGMLGEIYAFDGDYLYGRLHKITEGWRGTVLDYSVMQGGGVHLAALMLWLTGQRPSRVFAAGNRIVTRNTAFRYDDFVAATYLFDSGLVGRITANFGCMHRHQHVLRVFGSKATFLYDDQGARWVSSRDPETSAVAVPHSPFPESKGALIPAFIDAVVGRCDATAQTQHDLDVMSACFAADQARQTGQTMEIKYLNFA